MRTWVIDSFRINRIETHSMSTLFENGVGEFGGSEW